jgi:hypothetical protein
MRNSVLRRIAWAGLALAALTGLTGCGELTIRTWVKVIEADSTGYVLLDLPGSQPLPLTRIQGGILATIVMDTTTLPAPIEGTLTVEKIRLAASNAALSYVCAWANPELPSEGTVYLDVLGGHGSTEVTTNLRTFSGFGQIVTELSTSTVLTLEGDLLTAFLGAAESGSADGLFATRAPFEGTSMLSGIPVIFSMDLAVTNESTPPVIYADHIAHCAHRWAEQGTASYHGVNSKSSYLRAWPGDLPKPPRAIALSDLGVVPGDTLQLDTLGFYSNTTKLEDGNQQVMTAVFSSTNQVLASSQQKRIPGAIDAGTDINTGGFTKCLILCSFVSSDIPQDFRVDPSTSVVVPAGAN